MEQGGNQKCCRHLIELNRSLRVFFNLACQVYSLGLYPLAKGYCHHVCICLSVHLSIILDCGQQYYSISPSHTLHVTSLISMYWFEEHITKFTIPSFLGNKLFFCTLCHQAFFQEACKDKTFVSWYMLGYPQGLRLPTKYFMDHQWSLEKYDNFCEKLFI